ncbi:MAG: hypothetical protein EBR82_75470 [Caulobacteraceae bacterium]|nr:hypothetical protein [Caulobacteraceae bacterium]
MSNTLRNYESDTPETCEAVERWQQGKINIFDEMARLERVYGMTPEQSLYNSWKEANQTKL